MNESRLPVLNDHVFVTLIHPITILLGGAPARIIAIEGQLITTSEQFVVFRANRMLSYALAAGALDHKGNPVRPPFITMSVHVTVNTRNIAGLVLKEEPE